MTVLASPAFAKHTTHFSEAVTFLFHANLHPEVYPWWAEAQRVMHVKVTSKDYPWSHAFMKVSGCGALAAAYVRLSLAAVISGCHDRIAERRKC